MIKCDQVAKKITSTERHILKLDKLLN